jgi:pyruvate,water dikinase
MTFTQVWGALLIFILCPLLGGLPLIAWMTAVLTGQQLRQVGTGNVSVSAAFYHGGTLAGILAVLSEALKGIAAVLLARSFFPTEPAWELVALIALVTGRYWFGKGAGTTNVVWGYVVHDPIAAGLVFVISGISFTIWRERQQGRLLVLALLPLIAALRHPDEPALAVFAALLAGLMAWIYAKIPDDLDLNPQAVQADSQTMFRFFRGDRGAPTLDQVLDAGKVGAKAATLAELKRAGYPVPIGWVLLPGDDPEPLIATLNPTPQSPLIVRSSAVDEDSETAAAAGLYESIANVTSREALLPAIARCFASYDQPAAVQYRRDRNLPDTQMVVLIQPQIRGAFSGVAFSRDPIARQGDSVVIEALPGNAAPVVSGQVTPESYQVRLTEADFQAIVAESGSWRLPDSATLAVEGSGDVPPGLIQQVALLARHLEAHYHGIPQDIEWSYDGTALWLLQARPITTLLPIWTRKIAAEVIPGWIRPLTWSINRPLTCGVWGEIFTIVLGDHATGLDFTETATLHYSCAYFNATLLGKIFRRMGLPPESLEFLTRGAKFSKPPLRSTLRNLPGLLKLAQREWQLDRDFRQDEQRLFAPAIAELSRAPIADLSEQALLARIESILQLLKRATYYSILAPLSAALRKALFKIPDAQLDNSATPEVAALRSLQALADRARQILAPQREQVGSSAATVFAALAVTSEGQAILAAFDQVLDRYGYLSEVGTDIAVPTWREAPQPVRELFAQFCWQPPVHVAPLPALTGSGRSVQRRFTLKGNVTEVYSRLLAELRGCFVALEQQWLATGRLAEPGDIFWLEFTEIRQLIESTDLALPAPAIAQRLAQRHTQLAHDRQLATVPFIVYGDDPPLPSFTTPNWHPSQQLRGIGASPGQIEGQIKIVRTLTAVPLLDRDTVLVVPYTDSGWAPLLARVGGLISEVGGRLSHGAIVAREYRIPAVMDIPNATQLLRDGQRVRLDGQQGIVEIL